MTELRTTSIPDAVYAAVRQAILSGDVAAGDALTENAIVSRYGVARPSARAAIERLVAEGLLVREMHRVARVPQLSEADITDLYETRAVLEVAALANLARLATVPQSALHAHRMLLTLVDQGHTWFPDTDMEFHRALVVAQPNTRLAKMHSLIMGEVHMCIGQAQARQLMPISDIVDQHQRILDAVSAGDREGAITATRLHIDQSRDHILAHLREQRE